MESNTVNLKDVLVRALRDLNGTAGAIALEPKDPKYDAVDMFVLEKVGVIRTAGWSLHLIQDTIFKTRSFHPVKALWYCSLFCDAFKEVFPTAGTLHGDLLKCRKYIPLVPHAGPIFGFDNPTSTTPWEELDRVANLLDFSWPKEFSSRKGVLQGVVKRDKLKIPLCADGKPRKKLTKIEVGNALLLNEATKKVKHQCQVIFDIVNACGEDSA